MKKDVNGTAKLRGVISCFLLAALFISAPLAMADTLTWDGGDSSANNGWSMKKNWSPGKIPVSAADSNFIFANNDINPHATLAQDIASPFLLNSITFSNNALPFTLSGNQIQFGGAASALLQNSPTNEAINNALDLHVSTIFGGTGSGKVTINGVISGGGDLTNSSGTFFLSSTNGSTYTGATIINGGTLRVNNLTGSGTGTGTITVGSGGTLGGTGIVSGAITVKSGGTLAPGNSVGTFKAGPLTLQPGSATQIELASLTSFEKLTDTGSVSLGGNLNIVLLGGFAPAAGSTFTIMTTTTGASGSFASVTPGYTVNTVGNNVVLTVVPEPNVLALTAAGCLLVFMVISRRRQS